MSVTKGNAIIVEDDMLISLMEERLLQNLGYRVSDKFLSGENAIQEIKERDMDPNFILMDILLEGELNGLDTAKEIWSYSDTPILFVSGSKDLFEKSKFALTKRHSFVSKPFTKKVLKEGLNTLLLEPSYVSMSN
ncbi:response regulator [Balneolaceae bacterium YR4-1]|uniref:Response regulator n=1 Tax=Halalkalibaculum roseum TaxID=2709311 RepID=A0A6M1SX16_9BACT|nr:response regulator [Halalkalibaculum roseum]NGP76536.1 response regulator [Halalkalibaculum roseum]